MTNTDYNSGATPRFGKIISFPGSRSDSIITLESRFNNSQPFNTVMYNRLTFANGYFWNAYMDTSVFEINIPLNE